MCSNNCPYSMGSICPEGALEWTLIDAFSWAERHSVITVKAAMIAKIRFIGSQFVLLISIFRYYWKSMGANWCSERLQVSHSWPVPGDS